MTRRLVATIAGILVAAASILLAPAASADATAEPQIVEAVKRVPGGIVINSHTAHWPEYAMTLTVPDERLRDAIGACPHGSVCAFSGSSLSGSRLAWTTCGTHSTGALVSVRSIANARISGTLQARYGTTVRATASAQSWNNVTGSVDNVHC